MPASPIQCIIFDFGNVVAHFDYRQTYARFRPYTNLSEQQIRHVIDKSNLQELYETGRMNSETFLFCLKESCQLRCEDDVLVSAWSNIFRRNDDVCNLLSRLSREYRLVLGSNTNDLHAQHFRKQFAGDLEHFHALVLSFEVGVCKPNPRFFDHCRRQAACDPDACVLIDDIEENVESAKACGLHGIVYKDLPSLLEEFGRLGVRAATEAGTS